MLGFMGLVPLGRLGCPVNMIRRCGHSWERKRYKTDPPLLSLSLLRLHCYCELLLCWLRASMALLRVVLVVVVALLVCAAEVSSLAAMEAELTHINQVVVKRGHRRLMQDIDCDGLCKVRCSQHSRPNVCTRACGTCCRRCKCVPPGTSGNREMCGSCYTDMTTHGNQPKCP